jgi:hypothetical protein
MHPVSSASPASLDLARRLLDREIRHGKSPARTGSVSGVDSSRDDAGHTEQVCEKLRTILTVFAGSVGFRSLLARALTLAKMQEPSLADVQVLEDGSLEGLDKAGSQPRASAAETFSSGGLVLVAHLLDLLILFIGEPLTLQLVRSAWPEEAAGASRSRVKDTP